MKGVEAAIRGRQQSSVALGRQIQAVANDARLKAGEQIYEVLEKRYKRI